MNHRNTKIHKRCMQLIQVTAKVMNDLPTGYGFLADQLRRAASSVALNFAEGCGKATPRERKRFFGIAKASALESAAAFDVAKNFKVIGYQRHHDSIDLCDHIAAMLHRYR